MRAAPLAVPPSRITQRSAASRLAQHVVAARRARGFDRQAGGAHVHGIDDSSAARASQSGADPELGRRRPSSLSPFGGSLRGAGKVSPLGASQRTWSVPRVAARCPISMSSHRSPRRAPDHAPLIERAVEIEVLGEAVRCLTEGDGGVVVLDAPAGLGKTALLEHAALTAADAGCLVRRAAPGPLERHFPFGVVRALLEAPLREASDDERAQLLDGAAASAGTLLLDGAVPSGDSTMLVAHGVLWLCSALAEQRPLALVVDDAQWADRSSLEVLSLPGASDRRPAAADRRRRPRRRPARSVGPPEPARRGAVGHRPAPPAADAARRGAAHPPPGARDLGGRVPRLPSRGGRQPVAAGRAGPADRHPRPRGDRPGRRRPAARLRDRPQRHPLAAGHAGAPRPGRGGGARRPLRRRASRTSWRPSPASRSASWPRRATRCWPPGCSVPTASAWRTAWWPPRSRRTSPGPSASGCTARPRAR